MFFHLGGISEGWYKKSCLFNVSSLRLRCHCHIQGHLCQDFIFFCRAAVASFHPPARQSPVSVLQGFGMFLPIFIPFIITLLLCEGAFWRPARSVCERAVYPLCDGVCTGPGVSLNKSKHSLKCCGRLAPFCRGKSGSCFLAVFGCHRRVLRPRGGEFHLLQPPALATL